MANENEKDAGTFGGIDISFIEDGLGMKLGGSGEPSKEQDDKESKVKKKESLSLQIPGKIAVPETADEYKQLFGDKVEKGEESDDNDDNVADSTKGKQEKGGEDIEITEDSPLYLHAATLHEEGILPTLDLESLKGKPFKEGIQIL